jgi:predicted RNA-binding Zn-ribbon protein involved in translation (DUF1610 family)
MTPDPALAIDALLARMAALKRGERVGLLPQLLPLLAEPRLSLTTRLAAAARALRLLPDRRRPVRRVASAVTAGVSSGRAIERLRQVQNLTKKCHALDELIDAREQRVKMACPRCKVKLRRVEMVKHLWHEHGLTLDRRTTRTANRTAAELLRAYTAGDTAALDRMAELHGAAGLRSWMAEIDAPPEEVAVLLAAAGDRGAGLCRSCFAEVPASITPLPPPLDLANGRLSGDGYAVNVGGNAWVRTVTLTTPIQPAAGGRFSLSPRATATLVATVVLMLAILVRAPQIVGFALAAVAYVWVRFARTRRDADDRAVDVAWNEFAVLLAETEPGSRYLTRLCLASLGRGSPERRVDLLARLVIAPFETEPERQLLAAAAVLKLDDATRFGVDVVAGVAGLIASAFTGERPTDFAEHVAAAYLTRDRAAGDLARLRVLVLAAAFGAGHVPRDLVKLCVAAPALRRVVLAEPAPHLALLFGLWRTRDNHRWHAVGHGNTVFDTARALPRHAADTLAAFPDLLLSHRPERAVEDTVGPVLVCARGAAVAGHLVADPDADVRLEAGGRVLVLGRHRLAVSAPLPDDFPDVVRQWLAFRTGWLAELGAVPAAPVPEASRRLLGPLVRVCAGCGGGVIAGAGALGRSGPVS